MIRDPYYTLGEPFYYEAEMVKGSRFYVNVTPVSSESDAKSAIEKAHDQFPHARHHCWAMVLREGKVARPNDDGEPSGSAGKPILAQIQGRGIEDVIVVVSRFFGGTKLGVGGLVRAYGGSAGQALDAAPLIQVVPKQRVAITFDYADTAVVEAALSAEGYQASQSHYESQVTLEVMVSDAAVGAFITSFRERTAQRISVELMEE